MRLLDVRRHLNSRQAHFFTIALCGLSRQQQGWVKLIDIDFTADGFAAKGYNY